MSANKESLEKQIDDLKQEVDQLHAERPELHKFLTNNRKIIRFFTVGFLTTALVVHAAMPNIFAPGQVISASQVNANFAHLEGLIGGAGNIVKLEFSVNEVIDYSVIGSYNTTVYPYLAFSNITDPSGDVANIGGFDYFTAPATGWYSIYGHLPVAITQTNVDTAFESSYVTAHFEIYKGSLSGPIFVPDGSSILNMNNYNSKDDKDGDGSQDKDMGSLANPAKTSTFLQAGDRLAVKASYRIHRAGDQFVINAAEAHIIIKPDY
jgi:hypothetical protein